MSIFFLSLKSILNRRLTTFLTILSIAISVALLFGVERVRKGAWETFESTLSGTDLIIGARGGAVQLLLYSVFRMGEATNNMSWQSYQAYKNDDRIKWTIPISLGDSHKGYRVVGTDQSYFKYYRFGKNQTIKMRQGKAFSGVFEAVIGDEVAKTLGYEMGQEIILSHGISGADIQTHEDKPFTIVGIIERTGTPIDRAVHVSLEGIEAIHLGWESGAPPIEGEEVSPEEALKRSLQPTQITAMLVGLKSKLSIFRLQREVNQNQNEALMAILPGVTFQQLWSTVSVVEKALQTVSVFVVLTGLLGMLTSILTSLNERRREMAILRSLGAKPFTIFLLLLSESAFLAGVGCLLGVTSIYGLLYISQDFVLTQFGLFIPITMINQFDLLIVLGVFLAGLFAGSIPAFQAYRQSLSDGLTIRV